LKQKKDAAKLLAAQANLAASSVYNLRVSTFALANALPLRCRAKAGNFVIGNWVITNNQLPITNYLIT
jgi:hypothetical protein